jgi:hypothetical protein
MLQMAEERKLARLLRAADTLRCRASEIAFRRHLILPRDDDCLPGRGQSSPKASRDTGIAQRERRVRTRVDAS